MKYFSLFSGIGGFELGIKHAYENNHNRRGENREPKEKFWSSEENLLNSRNQSNNISSDGDGGRIRPICVGFSEIDKYATEVYQKNFNHKDYGDITKINEKELPDFDLLVGGFPCQSFSIAGKRGGFTDTRGTMFFEIARIVREKQPRLLLLENVKGLLSHDKGQTFHTIITTLDELGYDLQWQVLNSKNHGVPQNRERVFIIGHLRGTNRPQVFPIGETNNSSIKISKRGKHQQDIVYRTDGIMGTLAAGTHASTPHLTKIQQLNKPKHSNTGGPSARNGQKLVNGTSIRRLTPTECERLQGFPDRWTEGLSDTQRYKTLGNAVTVNVIKAIIEKLLN